MPVCTGIEAASLLLELFDKPKSPGDRLAFSECMLRLGGQSGLNIAVEQHGVMASLAVFDGSDWVYSFVPAQEWTLAYVRPPEVRKKELRLDQLLDAFPEARGQQSDHFTVRLRTHQEAQRYCDLLLANR